MATVRFLLLILAGGAICAGIVVGLSYLFSKNRWIKYLPSLLVFAYMFYAIVRATSFSEGMEGLAFILLAMLAFGAGLMSVLTAVVIDVLKVIERRKAKEAASSFEFVNGQEPQPQPEQATDSGSSRETPQP
jgi:hypothetical protein